MAATNKIPNSADSKITHDAEAFCGRYQVIQQFRKKLSGDLNLLQDKGQIKDAQETLDMLSTILDHRLM